MSDEPFSKCVFPFAIHDFISNIFNLLQQANELKEAATKFRQEKTSIEQGMSQMQKDHADTLDRMRTKLAFQVNLHISTIMVQQRALIDIQIPFSTLSNKKSKHPSVNPDGAPL